MPCALCPLLHRTVSQMVQAARSGKQNIAEASIVSGTSKESEIKLTNVARASLEELLIDYEDFLRTQKLSVWNRSHRLIKRIQELNKSVTRPDYLTFKKAIEHEQPEICANTMIALIKITTWLLDRQLRSLEDAFLYEGGMRERMAKVRTEIRNKRNTNQRD
jgi:four helix bundle suffix protein